LSERSSRARRAAKPAPADADPAGPHGAHELPAVTIDGYNALLKDESGRFLGDRASDRGLQAILDRLREKLAATGDDPLGDEPTEEIGDKKLDKLLKSGEPAVAGVVWSALEEFAQELAHVTRVMLRLKEWRRTERIAVGGGFSGTRIGEQVVGRTGVLLKEDGVDVELRTIHHDPDCAGLIGATQLVPVWNLDGFDAILAVDIGGTKLRTGIVELRLEKAKDLSAAKVGELRVWRHADDQPGRNQLVDRLVDMLHELIAAAGKEKLRLAPLIGIACPGTIDGDGHIRQGAQNLPGAWEAPQFKLPRALQKAIPEIGKHETIVRIHNDAVVQGLSEVPFMQDVKRWGILTIGTGLGNARFTNRSGG
jgi:predicted NBD/HSP70 family sugar kinase